jgi:hypothetical protein
VQVSFGKLKANQTLNNYIDEKREKDLRQVLNRFKRSKKILSELEIMIVTAKCLDLLIKPQISGRRSLVENQSCVYYSLDFDSPKINVGNKTTAHIRVLTIKFTYFENKFVECSVDYLNGRSFSTKNKKDVPSMLVDAKNNLATI